MPVTREVKIIKVPLSDKERAPDYPKKFSRMPRLYLELLENKAKIKQDLINKEYVPPNDLSEVKKETQEQPKELPPVENKKEDDKSRSISVSSSDTERQSIKEDTEIREKNRSDSNSDSYTGSSRSSSYSDSDSDSDSETDRNKSIESRSSSYSSKTSKTTDSDALSDRLKDLLGDTESERSVSKESYDKYSRGPKQQRHISKASSHFTPYDKYKQQDNNRTTAAPPTLAELEAKGHYHHKPELRDINHIGVSEYEEEDKKREIIFKFGLLKKSYPGAALTIPEYTVHSDFREMQKSYDDTVRRLSLDSTVDNYKTYLIGGFMVVEFVFGNFLGFDMQGFTQQQIVSMHSYEKLLIELGEKSYVPTGSKWPVELRLLFLIIMNAAFFIVSKMIMRKTGANLLNMVNSMNTTSQPPASARPKRRMKGPNINLDDIPDVDDTPVTGERANK